MRIIVYRELKPRKGIPYTRTHVRRLEAVGRFPRSFRLGANTKVWDEDEIDRHLDALRAARDAAE